MNSSIYLLILLLLTIKNVYCSSKVFKISLGLIYCNETYLKRAEDIALELNSEKMLNSKSKILIEIKSVKLRQDENAISISLAICDKLLANLYALILTDSADCLSTNNDSQLTLSAIAYTCGYYQIPVFDLINRNALFSDKTIYSTFIRMIPPGYQQAIIWIELLKYFDWKSVNLIYSSDDDGKQLASRLQYLTDQNGIVINSQVEFDSNNLNYTYILDVLMASHSKVFLLYAE